MLRRNIQIEMDVIITKHAFRRMMERGCKPAFAKEYIQRIREFSLMKNRRNNYVIHVPFKGWLVGLIECDRFIVKTFMPTLRDLATSMDATIVIRRVIIPNWFGMD